MSSFRTVHVFVSRQSTDQLVHVVVVVNLIWPLSYGNMATTQQELKESLSQGVQAIIDGLQNALIDDGDTRDDGDTTKRHCEHRSENFAHEFASYALLCCAIS